MKRYTLEDVEYIRSRSDCNYDEIIGLLDAYEGDVARVLADLERQGRLKSKDSNKDKSFGEAVKELLKNGYTHRLIIKKDDTVIVNISVLLSLIVLIVIPYITIPVMILLVLLGYHISFSEDKKMEDTFKNAATVVKENAKQASKVVRDSARSAKEAYYKNNENKSKQYSTDAADVNWTPVEKSERQEKTESATEIVREQIKTSEQSNTSKSENEDEIIIE